MDTLQVFQSLVLTKHNMYTCGSCETVSTVVWNETLPVRDGGFIYWTIAQYSKHLERDVFLDIFKDRLLKRQRHLAPIKFEYRDEKKYKSGDIAVYFWENWDWVLADDFFEMTPERTTLWKAGPHGFLYMNDAMPRHSMDVWYVIEHELGHNLNIWHNPDESSVMFGLNIGWWIITQEEIRWINYLYGIIKDQHRKPKTEVLEKALKRYWISVGRLNKPLIIKINEYLWVQSNWPDKIDYLRDLKEYLYQ